MVLLSQYMKQSMIRVGVLTAILFFSLIIRLYRANVVPVAPYWDEVAILAEARMILETGRDLHSNAWFQPMFISYGDYKMPVYIWLTTFFSQFFGVTVFAVRFGNILAGVGSVLLAGLLSVELLDLLAPTVTKQFKRLALFFSMGTAAIIPWGVHFSRSGFEAYFAQFLLGTAVYVLLIGLRKKPINYSKRKLVVLALVSGLLAALAMYTYFSIRVVLPILFPLIILVTNFIYRYEKLNTVVPRNVSLFFIASAVILLSLVPLLTSPLYEQSNGFRLSTSSLLELAPFVEESNSLAASMGNSFQSKTLFHRRVLQGKFFLTSIAKHLSPTYLFFEGDQNLRHGTTKHGLLLLTMAPGLVAGWLWLFSNNKALALVLGGWWFAALLPASIPLETPHALRSLNAVLPITISIGIGFAALATWLQRKTKALQATVVLLFFFVLIFECIQYWHYYLQVYPKTSSQSWQHGYTALAQIVYEQSQTKAVWIPDYERRLWLWLYAFTSLDTRVIQESIKTGGPLPKVIGRISIHDVQSEDLNELTDPVVIVANTFLADHIASLSNHAPTTVFTIQTTDPTFSYKALYYEP